MKKKKDSLLFKFAGIFMIFTLVTVFLGAINTYINQKRTYNEQFEDSIRNIAGYLEEMIVSDGMDFVYLQDYFMEHYDEILVRYDFSGDCEPEREKFEGLFEAEYPDKVLGADIDFPELSDEVKLAYAVYQYEYYLNMFEKARDAFGIAYAYYIVPADKPSHVIFMIDGVREEKVVSGEAYISLGIDVYENPKDHESLWTAWNTGTNPDGYDSYNNEFGKTYAYYTPLIINKKKMGLIGTEIYTDVLNKEIFSNAVKQSISMGIILILCMLVMLWVINKHYISKIRRIEHNVRDYTTDKNPIAAKLIEDEAVGKDELSSLSKQLAAMILEIEDHIKNLKYTSRELTSTRKRADEMNVLAYKDALTGICNKTAYDEEMQRLSWAVEDGYARFGIAMIDLNFLKRINDTYGHKQGDVAIKKLCGIISEIFGNTDIYRIGGDEFVVILENMNYRNADQLVEQFNKRIEEISNDESLKQWERTSAAIGIALYDPDQDHSVANVFKRADKEMYDRKKAMKAVRM